MEETKRALMKPVFIAADNITSPVGNTTSGNMNAVKNGLSGIKEFMNADVSDKPFFAAKFSELPGTEHRNDYTRFEQLCISSIAEALSGTDITLRDNETIFILSTTKGNIELIENNRVDENLRKRVSLSETAHRIARHFVSPNSPLVVSNACISGLVALLTAKRVLESGTYKNAVITGADLVSKFVVSGFQSLYALSDKPCRPFDKDRDGINLGECAATIVLTSDTAALNTPRIQIKGAAVGNDANHISGPSRTGEELSYAINITLKESEVIADDLSFISAHGTATVYNDEMEAKAFNLSGLAAIPVHSLKGNFGHTLGAAGILESILTYRSLEQGIILPSKNFATLGVTPQITVNAALKQSGKNHALKTASGFGGCNAAIVYSMT